MMAQAIAPFAADRWPGRTIQIVCTFMGLYEFRYPRGLGISDFPYVGEPAWKVRDSSYHFARAVRDGQLDRTNNLNPFKVLRSAGEIWFFCGNQVPRWVNAYDVLLTQFLGAEVADLERPAMFTHAVDEVSMARAFASPSTTHSPTFRELSNAASTKRFFDFNFNVNALAIFGESLRRVGVDTEIFGMSKFSLQLLYWFKGRPPMTEGRLIKAMDNWTGTGRYPVCEMGSTASRARIVSELCEMGLLTHEGLQIALSAKGAEFLSLLHPDCEDSDLPARIAAWQGDWPQSKENMTRYIRTFFGKQSRFKPAS
jgi:hypothetical protein